jgi:hypothetical protein
MGGVGAANDDRTLCTDNVRRAVATAPYWLSFVKLNHLAVIDICTESPLSRFDVGCERIRRKLNPVR